MKKHVCNFPPKKANNDWVCKICGEIFRTRREMQKHKKDAHPGMTGGFRNKGGHSWNYGQTKYTNETIARISETIKRKYSLGEIKIEHRQMSKETREKISKAISKRNETIQGGNGGRKDVAWFHIQNLNGVEFIVRGTWELNVAKRLNDLGILWIRNQRITYIRENINRQYNPDFYLPVLNSYIEVKGWFKEEDKIKMNLVHQQHPECKIYFIDSKWYNEFVSNGILKDEMIYNGRW